MGLCNAWLERIFRVDGATKLRFCPNSNFRKNFGCCVDFVFNRKKPPEGKKLLCGRVYTYGVDILTAPYSTPSVTIAMY